MSERAGGSPEVTDGTPARDDRYAHPMKIECHQGLHAPDCSGEWCTCDCHNKRRKKVEG